MSKNIQNDMKVVVTGHRLHKLESYNHQWIKLAIHESLQKLQHIHGYIRGYVGMASGVDLWFCQSCIDLKISYVACIPFDKQEDGMSYSDVQLRQYFINHADCVRKVRNSWMVEEAEMGLIIWDGNKGGTHNVIQQLIERKKSFIWINPVSCIIWPCLINTDPI